MICYDISQCYFTDYLSLVCPPDDVGSFQLIPCELLDRTIAKCHGILTSFNKTESSPAFVDPRYPTQSTKVSYALLQRIGFNKVKMIYWAYFTSDSMMI